MSAKVWVGLVIALALAGWWAVWVIEENGYEQCEADHAAKVEKVQQELRQLRAERAAERERYTGELARLRARERAHVANAPGVAAWWDGAVPGAAADYAYGVRGADDQGAVRP